jgi:hypothetical protein
MDNDYLLGIIMRRCSPNHTDTGNFFDGRKCKGKRSITDCTLAFLPDRMGSAMNSAGKKTYKKELIS